MDRWLARVDADHRKVALARKIIQDKPGTVAPRCTNGKGTEVPSEMCHAKVAAYGTPRLGAGEPMTNDVMKCQLGPLRRDDYPVTFTDDQWKQLQQASPWACATTASGEWPSTAPCHGSPTRTHAAA